MCSPFFLGGLGGGLADGAAAVAFVTRAAKAGFGFGAAISAIWARRSRILASRSARSVAHAVDACARSK